MDNLPFINPRNIILCGDKSVISGKYFIDDKVDNLERAANIQYKLLFPDYHNIKIQSEELIKKDIVRIKDYAHLKRFINGELLEGEIKDTISSVLGLYFEKNIDYNFTYYTKSKQLFLRLFISRSCKNRSFTKKLYCDGVPLQNKLQSLLGVKVIF